MNTTTVPLVLLITFTSLVFLRSLKIQSELRVGFCTIHFDCGCGTGRVWICGKLLENAALIGFATVLVWFGGGKKSRRKILTPDPSEEGMV